MVVSTPYYVVSNNHFFRNKNTAKSIGQILHVTVKTFGLKDQKYFHYHFALTADLLHEKLFTILILIANHILLQNPLLTFNNIVIVIY